ncbi:MAG: hypothetical protein EBW68_07840 [Actinobacteria bacterium]|nr:hypothetical protein [Actinomycetota bacterium]
MPAAQIFATAKKRHGVTNDVNEAGYVLPDGTMLDFSGRADAGYVQGSDLRFRPKTGERDYMRGERGVDHREVEWQGQPPYKETWQPMVDFMKLGAIRMDRSGMISIHGRFMPSAAQLRVLKDLVTQAGGAYLDLEDSSGKRAAITLESDKFAKVQGLIRRWAAGEDLAEVQQIFSQAELAAAQKANESKLSALGLPTKPGTRMWAKGAVQTALRESFGWKRADYWFPDVRSTGGAVVMFSLVLWMRAQFSTQADFMTIMMPTIIQGIAVAFFFIPLSTLTLNGIPPAQMPSASGLSNFMRILGGSFGTSVTITLWQDRTAMHHAELAETINRGSQATTSAISNFAAAGMSQEQGLASINRLIDQQAATMAADDIFLASAFIFLLLIPIIWLAKPMQPPPQAVPLAKPTADAAGAH